MSVHFVTGKLGGGKTLVSVGRIQDYLLAGKRVATNLDLNLEYLIPRNNKKAEIYRIPDKPTITDLEAIGHGTYSKREEDFGLLVLDELGTWLNSRTYQKDQDRQAVIDWFLHARKLGWDVLLIVQNIDLIDKQVRIALAEHVVICRRTDRIPLPLVGMLFKMLTGVQIKLPRIHIGTVFYGVGQGAIKVDNWIYRGNGLFDAYDTAQVFQKTENRVSQFIPPAFLNQKRFAVKNRRFYMRLTKIYFKRLKTPLAFGCGVLMNFVILAGFLLYNNSAIAEIDPQGVAVDPQVVEQSSFMTNEEKLIEYSYEKLSVIRTFEGGQVGELVVYEGSMILLDDFPYEIKRFGRDVFAYLPVSERKGEAERNNLPE